MVRQAGAIKTCQFEDRRDGNEVTRSGILRRHHSRGPEYRFGLSNGDIPGCVAPYFNIEGLKAAAEDAPTGHLQLSAASGAAVPRMKRPLK